MSPKINNNLPNEKDTRIAQLEEVLALEAALKKVRARTIVMQKSEELSQVASAMFTELRYGKYCCSDGSLWASKLHTVGSTEL